MSYNWTYLDFYSGYNIDPDKWDENSQRVKRNASNRSGQTAAVINSYLNKMLAAMFDTFNEFELLNQVPEPDILTARFNEKMQGVNVALKSIAPHKKPVDFWKVYREFMTECSHKRSWTDATIEKFNALKQHIKNYDEVISLANIADNGNVSTMLEDL